MSNKSSGKAGEKFKSKIGGQAVIEGVMMRGLDKAAMACRLPDGTIDMEEWSITSGKKAPWYKRTPFVRGIFSFVSSMIDGYKCMTRSAEKQMTEDDEEELTKFEKWLNDKFGDKIMTFVTGVSVVLGVALALLSFMYIPSKISEIINHIINLNSFAYSCIEGIIKIGIFIAYTALTALMKDIRRTYEYHGAEHKTIACYEHEEELTVENVKKHKRFHPRCGTSFIFLVLFISIFVNTVFGLPLENPLLRVVCKIAVIPLVTGIAYEIIRLAGKYNNIFTRIISAPGLAIQRITTREPDESEIECAIAALKAVIPKDKEEDRW